MRKALNGLKPEEAVEKILDMFVHTKNNKEFIDTVQKIKFFQKTEFQKCRKMKFFQKRLAFDLKLWYAYKAVCEKNQRY